MSCETSIATAEPAAETCLRPTSEVGPGAQARHRPSNERTEKVQVDAEYVRNWARKRGFDVGVRGHLSKSLVKYFNERHHHRYYRSNNPWEKQ